jgi:chromosomal replication initiation ATPase DnaA
MRKETEEVLMDDATFLYKRTLETKLINRFKAEFYEKIGYTPEVITFVDEKNNLPIVSLDSMISIFEDIMTEEFGNRTLNGHKIRITSPIRKRDVVEYRYIYFRIARLMGHVLTDIAESLIGKKGKHYDHTTVIHGCNTCDDLVQSDEKFALAYQKVINQIRLKFNIKEI